jgi:hypothetical protein
MRRSLVVLALATAPLAVRAAPAAGPAPASLAPPPAQARAAQPRPDPTLAFYPAAARAAGIEGQAVIRCAHDAHLAMKDCTLVSESPPGQGFGAAALAMAAQSPDNPKVTLPGVAAAPPDDTTIRFTLRPPNIEPDATQMVHTQVRPSIVSQPTAAQIQAAYPVRALSDQVQGAGAIDCLVTGDGKLARCQVAAEEPPGYGFGQATLDLAADFVMKPRLVDGELDPRAVVRVGVKFSPADSTAPLSLDTQPPKP